MKITLTKAWLEKNGACGDGVSYRQSLKGLSPKEMGLKAIEDGRSEYAFWALARKLNRKGRTKLAVFSAEIAISDFEAKYPEDKRPRLALEAAKAVIKKDSAETRQKARSATSAANDACSADAAKADYAANDAAYAAANAAYAAANAAYAAYAASDDAATAAATAAAQAAAYADERKAVLVKVFLYGLRLLSAQRA